ncbi:MAG: hypothetical protein JRG95_15705, partial [Deltaproteobacteria bacterium]|nr:hypothetical protein [Deltaproteobacteria bacterium]
MLLLPRVVLLCSLSLATGVHAEAAAEAGADGPDTRLVQRGDENRPEQQRTFSLFGRPLVVGGELEIRSEFEGDFALDPDEEDDILTIVPKLEIELFYPLSRDVSAFAEGKLRFGWQADLEDGRRRSQLSLERGEAWVNWNRVGGSPFAL